MARPTLLFYVGEDRLLALPHSCWATDSKHVDALSTAAFARGPDENDFNEQPRLTEAELCLGGSHSILNATRSVSHGVSSLSLGLLKHVSTLENMTRLGTE
jgi:hypothetical protein